MRNRVVTSDSMARALLESDRRYFELGSTVDALGGARIVWMPGMEKLPAACVVHRVTPESIEERAGRWVHDVTRRTTDLGCALARVYLDGPAPLLEEALAAAGYRRRVEVGYLVEGRLPPVMYPARRDVELREVVDEDGWEAKRKVHAGSEVAADGHANASDAWVDFERRKCDTGGMRAFLVEVSGEACGCVASLEDHDLLRVKNLFVRADRRREGIAAQVLRLLSERAGRLGLAATGTFGIDGKPGDAVYRHLGMTPVVSQIEWSLPLPAEMGTAPA